MDLPLKKIVKFCEENSQTTFNILSADRCIAAVCATQLSGQPHRMLDLDCFDPRGGSSWRTVPWVFSRLCYDLLDEWRRQLGLGAEARCHSVPVRGGDIVLLLKQQLAIHDFSFPPQL